MVDNHLQANAYAGALRTQQTVRNLLVWPLKLVTADLKLGQVFISVVVGSCGKLDMGSGSDTVIPFPHS
jgi:hypothetical protein